MTSGRKQLSKKALRYALLLCTAFLIACKSSGGIDILGPSDETADAANIVIEANKELKAIKVLYENHENKREELKKAMSIDDAAAVKKISDDLVYIINDGAKLGMNALEKIEQARDMNINSDYQDYLRLKSVALKHQLEAFEQYRQAAISLRENYDPKNTQLRQKVSVEFKERSENFQKIMEKARESSTEANELAKDALKKQADE